MPARFPPWSNTAIRVALALVGLSACGAVLTPMIYVRTPWNTGQFAPVSQPVLFDHRHHVQDDGIACLYCHPDAERSRWAGVPSTEVCMGCHSQVWATSPELALVRDSWFTGQSIAWRRVNWVPDFVYFDHATHVRGGVACESCHGRVADMAQVEQVAPLTMEWCLACHRQRQHGVGRSLTHCTACHR